MRGRQIGGLISQRKIHSLPRDGHWLSRQADRGAFLRLRVRGGGFGIVSSDGIILSFAEPGDDPAESSIAFARAFGQYTAGLAIFPIDDTGLLGGVWTSGREEEFALDLSALPTADQVSVNLVPELNTKRFLDVTVTDDSAVDFMELVLVHPSGPTALTLVPETAVRTVGTEHCVVATVSDGSGGCGSGAHVQRLKPLRGRARRLVKVGQLVASSRGPPNSEDSHPEDSRSTSIVRST